MGLNFNGTDIDAINYTANGVTTALTQLKYNGTLVWSILKSCSISGTAEEGQALTVSVVPNSIENICSYQWYRATTSGTDGTPISGATSSTYTIVNDDRTYFLYCIVTLEETSVKSNYSSAVIGWETIVGNPYEYNDLTIISQTRNNIEVGYLDDGNRTNAWQKIFLNNGYTEYNTGYNECTCIMEIDVNKSDIIKPTEITLHCNDNNDNVKHLPSKSIYLKYVIGFSEDNTTYQIKDLVSDDYRGTSDIILDVSSLTENVNVQYLLLYQRMLNPSAGGGDVSPTRTTNIYVSKYKKWN